MTEPAGGVPGGFFFVTGDGGFSWEGWRIRFVAFTKPIETNA